MVPPLPVSRSALDALGKRLAQEPQARDADLDLLLEVLSAYQLALAEAYERLMSAGYAPTSRTKTTSALIDKLRRERSSLKSVQDVAGARIVCDGGREEQDRIVEAVVRLFADGEREPKVKDRRTEPSNGYRAVHVVVHVQGLPVEVQVRTRLQDQWAQIVESLGDRWGRGIRYGQPPPDADQPLFGRTGSRQELWRNVLEIAELIDALERHQDALSLITRELHERGDLAGGHGLRPDVARFKEQLSEQAHALDGLLGKVAAVTAALD